MDASLVHATDDRTEDQDKWIPILYTISRPPHNVPTGRRNVYCCDGAQCT